MVTYFLRKEDVPQFYGRLLREFRLFVPEKIASPFKVKCEHGFDLPSDDYILKEYCQDFDQETVFSDYRSIEPAARAFFTYFKEETGSYFVEKDLSREQQDKPIAVAGIKNCDIFSLKIQEYVFLEGGHVDPLFAERRKNALIVSGDCPHFKETCFCRAFGINPYATEGFDFNFSPLNHGFLVDVATDRAKEIVASLGSLFAPATAGQLSGRQSKRDTVIRRMEEHLAHHAIPKKEVLQDIVVSGYDSPVWKEQMQTCVECGGCIFMCDTCHCFLLADEPSEKSSKRVRVWDGCLLKNFTKVAGGANPLKMRSMRLRNRYMKKFDFFVTNLKRQACCGCGRCIDVCPGRIDIRLILRRLYEEKYLPAR